MFPKAPARESTKKVTNKNEMFHLQGLVRRRDKNELLMQKQLYMYKVFTGGISSCSSYRVREQDNQQRYCRAQWRVQCVAVIGGVTNCETGSLGKREEDF